ncbi:hypothetical protein RAMLITH_06655 [Ramlibacter sp. RBP-2]|uniref:Uncharacterized protein n=1 Tax=Ramlibacter lithotrophicus TaxID=2606681 RepID=A0A7X6I5N0_9BURK|nr:hypothetical protein [Ramlibacter lithotrophicus]NKE65498.1 hypothetical protein [Ramlibacter lithotrophicus]
MSDRFWLWTATAVFTAVILGALAHAVAVARDCERQGGTMVRSFSAWGWSCVRTPAPAQPPR